MNQLDMIRQLLEGVQPRTSVMTLAHLMEFKLRKNASKSRNWPAEAYNPLGEREWADLFPSYLLERIKDETRELQNEVRDLPYSNGDPMAVALECADVANFAMMIADNALGGRGLGRSYIDDVQEIDESVERPPRGGESLEDEF